MRTFLTLFVSVGLLAASGFTAWFFMSLSKNVEFTRQDAGTSVEVRVP
ncbi:MAG: hypothetical protein ACKO2G_08130 [Verrucomicrobiales bacterium]